MKDYQTTEDLIAALQQDKGFTFRASVDREFLQRFDQSLKSLDESFRGSPDTLIFEARTLLNEAVLQIAPTQEAADVADPLPVSGVTLTETRELRGMFWGEPEGLVFSLGNQWIRVGGKFITGDTPEEDAVFEEEWKRLCKTLNARNERHGFTAPPHAPTICPICAKLFTPGRRDQRFCSRRCKDAAAMRRHRAGKRGAVKG